MRRLLFIIILLCLSIYTSYRYLLFTLKSRVAFHFVPCEQAFLLQKKDIVLDDRKDFVLQEYFDILCNSDISYRYQFEENHLFIYLKGKKFAYPYQIKEPKIETVEKTIYKEVVKEVPVYLGNPNTESDETTYESYPEEDYFHLRNDYLSFPIDSDLSVIIEAISSDIDTNMQVSIDYSLLNPNQIGQYPIQIHTSDQDYVISVEIY
ncbi:MAG: hypothetical protein IIZ95_00380 [Erysipelotrichaceae bacterium]|nr:hypothetical protein [Erysipelotrichaceae bacterium]